MLWNLSEISVYERTSKSNGVWSYGDCIWRHERGINERRRESDERVFPARKNVLRKLSSIQLNEKNWRTRVSIPVPLECKSSALPFELVPLHNRMTSLSSYISIISWWDRKKCWLPHYCNTRKRIIQSHLTVLVRYKGEFFDETDDCQSEIKSTEIKTRSQCLFHPTSLIYNWK